MQYKMFRASTIGTLRVTKLADCFMSADFFLAFMKINLKKVVRLIDIFITLFSNRHII